MSPKGLGATVIERKKKIKIVRRKNYRQRANSHN